MQKSVFMTNRILRFCSLFLSFFLLSSILTSCGDSQATNTLKTDCALILRNLKVIYSHPPLFENSDYVDDDYIATNLGEKSRAAIEREILLKFPYMDDIIVGRKEGKQQIDNYYSSGTVYLIQQALIGTTIKFPYSSGDIQKIAKGEIDYGSTAGQFAENTFGDDLDLENSGGCAIIDKDKKAIYSYPKTNITSIAYDWAESLYYDFAGTLQVIRDCQVSGIHITIRCARNDYEYKPGNWTPTPINPFTRTWNDPVLEGMAKFAWCWNQGRRYAEESDSCI